MKKIIIILAILLCVSLFGCVDDDVQADTDTSTNLKATESELESKAEVVCTVTFDSLGGTAVETQEVVCGGKAIEPTTPTKKCLCEFDGWYLGEEKWSFIGYSVTEDITLTAKWIECYGLNREEIDILKGFISSKYDGKRTWKDVDSIKKEHSPDFECYDYTITFKDGNSFLGSIWSEFVDN